MNVRTLVLGSGAREHALAWRLSQDPGVAVLLAPGNRFAASTFPCSEVRETDPADVVALAQRERIDLVVIGPEAPLAAGVTDALVAAGIAVYGPSRAAARIESSKWFAKELMREAAVPTARAEVCTTIHHVERALETFGAPHVVKDDGLAAGKGVLVTRDRQSAWEFARDCLREAFVGIERKVVIEEFLPGEELSVMAVCDGERSVLLPAARDYKRAFDGDLGPNTGGMGAFAPVPGLPAGIEDEITTRIVTPVLRAMAARGTPYRGTLYCGLMMGPQGARVIEFNSRFGDPETEVIMPLVTGNLSALLSSAARGALTPDGIDRREGACVAVAIADREYPGRTSGEAIVEGLDRAAMSEGVSIFGAALEPAGTGWRVRGGRGACLMAYDRTLAGARARAYAAIETLGGSGWRCRGDIATAGSRPSSIISGNLRVREVARTSGL